MILKSSIRNNTTGTMIVCRPEGRQLPLPKNEIYDKIPGFKCDNCECAVCMSPKKVELLDENSIVICYDCFGIVLSDTEYVSKRQFLDVNDPEKNVLGEAMYRIFGKS